MKSEIKAKFTAALRSGEYPQQIGFLNRGGKFCCLGVLSEIAVEEGICNRHDSYGDIVGYIPNDADNDVIIEISLPPVVVQKWAELSHIQMASLTNMNDSRGCSFAEIADWVDANL